MTSAQRAAAAVLVPVTLLSSAPACAPDAGEVGAPTASAALTASGPARPEAFQALRAPRLRCP